MRLLLMLLSAAATNSWAAKVDQKLIASNQMGATMAIEGHYANLFPTVKEYFAEQKRIGVITESELQDIEKFLLSHGVPMQARLPKVSVAGRSLNWGKYKIEVLKDGTFKTQNGRIIHPNANDNYVGAFKNIYSAVTTETATFSLLSWLLPQADAASVGDAVDATATAVSGAAGELVYSSVVTGLMGVQAVSVPLCSISVLPVDWLKYQARWAMFNKTVDCKDGQFRRIEYPSFKSTVGKDFSGGVAETNPKDSSPNLWGAYKGTCMGPLGDLVGATSISNRSADSGNPDIAHEVSKQTLEKTVGADSECTPEKAKIVQKYLREEANLLAEKATSAAKRGFNTINLGAIVGGREDYSFGNQDSSVEK